MAENKTKKPVPSQVKKSGNSKLDSNLTAEIITIIFGVFGLFLLFSLWFKMGGVIGEYLNIGLTGIFGFGAYVLPLALIATVICHFAVKTESKTVHISVLFLLICVLIHFVHIVQTPGYTSGGIAALWKIGISSQGGGVVGGVLAELLVRLVGQPITAVILFAGVMIDIILLFKISVLSVLGRFFRFLGRSIKDCFSSWKNSGDDVPDFAEDEDLPETINIKPKKEKKVKTSPVQEEEISINYPLEDEPTKSKTRSGAEEKPPVALEQMQLTETPAEEKNNVDKDIAEDIEKNKDKPVSTYIFPSSDLLDLPKPTVQTDKVGMMKESAARLREILDSFGIEAKITNVTCGSSVTRYEVVPAAGVKVSKITALDQDIAMRLPAQNVRIEVLPGSVGIEASNDKVSAVFIRDMIESSEFNSHPSKIAVALGRDINGKTVVVDIAKMPHLLIAGTTGSGKSVCINAMITSILFKATPEEVRLIMVDPKAVELEMYNNIPHLLVPIVTDPRKAAGALCWAVNEMEERYKKFAENSVRNLSGYNAKMEKQGESKLPQIVIIIDELADLMMVAPGEVQDYICRLAQKARAAGMHLVLATQRPSVDVITGLIKANIPSRFSFQVSNHIDSRTILDCGGAEKLMGKGDMLMMIAGSNKLVRVQGAFVSDGDVERVTNFIKSNCDADYDETVQKSIEGSTAPEVKASDDEIDELFDEAVEVAFELDQISTSMIQRRLKVGYARAGRLIDLMDKMGVISPYDGSNKPRTLRMTREQFLKMRSGSDDFEDIPEDDEDIAPADTYAEDDEPPFDE